VLERAGVHAPGLPPGAEAATRPPVATARQRGYANRIGFDATRLLPGGARAADAATRVRAAYDLIADAGGAPRRA
jgi:hypothetical protein